MTLPRHTTTVRSLRPIIAFALLFSLLMSSAGVAFSARSAAHPRAGGTIQIGIWQEPDFLTWLVGSTSFSNQAIQSSMYDPPLTVMPDGTLKPNMLTAVPTTANGGISKDGLTYTLHLRKGLKWSDGQPVTMQDYVYTWKTVVNPKTAVVNNTGWGFIKSIATPDNYTAIVRLKKLYTPFVNVTLASSYSYWMPQHILTKPGADLRKTFGRQPVSNGPFRFVSWTSGDNMVVERNPYYWRPVGLDKIIYRFFADRDTIIAQLKAGNIDAGYDLNEVAIGQLQGTPNLRVYAKSSANVEIYYFNFNDPNDLSKPHPLFSDPNVRLALAEAIDRFSIANKLLYGKAEPAVNYLDNSAWSDTKLKPYPYDPANAAKLLDQAGWKMGSDGIRAKNGKRMSLTLTTTSGNPLRAQVQVLVQDELRKLGVDVKIKNYPPSQLFGSAASGGIVQSRKFDIVGYTDAIVGIDPDISFWWTKEGIPTKANGGTGFNVGGFYDPALEPIANAQAQTVDVAKRKALLIQAQDIAYKDVPAIFMYDRLDVFAANSRIKHVQHTDDATNAYLWNVWQWSM